MTSLLDLNNLPDDNLSSKQPLDDSSSAAAPDAGIYRRKNNKAKDERVKVYECRFCSLKFNKSQALGGHMNRHRQEREAETLNNARQLVFSTDNNPPHHPHQLHHQLGGEPTVHGGYHYAAGGYNMGGPNYPTRLFPGSCTNILPQHQHMYTSLASSLNNAHLSKYSNSQLINDYFVDRCLQGAIRHSASEFEIRCGTSNC